MIEKRLNPKQVANLMGVPYRKALVLMKKDIRSWQETCTGNNRTYRYTYESQIEDYQQNQIGKAGVILDHKKPLKVNRGLDTRGIREFLAENR
jgi:hypothetical protein